LPRWEPPIVIPIKNSNGLRHSKLQAVCRFIYLLDLHALVGVQEGIDISDQFAALSLINYAGPLRYSMYFASSLSFLAFLRVISQPF